MRDPVEALAIGLCIVLALFGAITWVNTRDPAILVLAGIFFAVVWMRRLLREGIPVRVVQDDRQGPAKP